MDDLWSHGGIREDGKVGGKVADSKERMYGQLKDLAKTRKKQASLTAVHVKMERRAGRDAGAT